MSDLTACMGELSGASREKSKIIKTIDEIVIQTNLLALNAAVEAAPRFDCPKISSTDLISWRVRPDEQRPFMSAR